MTGAIRAVRVTPVGEAPIRVDVVAPSESGWHIEELREGEVRLRDPAGETHIARLTPIRAGDPRHGSILEVVVDGWRFELEVEDEARAVLRERASRDRGAASIGGTPEIRAIIPGRIVELAVAPGDRVEAGDRVLVLEAMKMQNELRAPRAGSVTRVGVGAGDTVEIGDLLLVIE